MAKKTNGKRTEKAWIIRKGKPEEVKVTRGDECVFVHPRASWHSRRDWKRRIAEVLSVRLVFRTREQAIEALKPKPVWYVSHDGPPERGKLVVRDSPANGQPERVLFNGKGAEIWRGYETFETLRSALAHIVKRRSKSLREAEREAYRARQRLETAQRQLRRARGETHAR